MLVLVHFHELLPIVVRSTVHPLLSANKAAIPMLHQLRVLLLLLLIRLYVTHLRMRVIRARGESQAARPNRREVKRHRLRDGRIMSRFAHVVIVVQEVQVELRLRLAELDVRRVSVRADAARGGAVGATQAERRVMEAQRRGGGACGSVRERIHEGRYVRTRAVRCRKGGSVN